MLSGCIQAARVGAPGLGKARSRGVSRRDLDALTSFYAPDAVWEVAGLGTHEGTAEIRRFFEAWFDAYEECEVELQEILDPGNGVAFAVVVQRGRPVCSTGRVQLRYATPSIWVGGMMARQTNHGDSDEARADADASRR
jgi:hypothetical protein